MHATLQNLKATNINNYEKNTKIDQDSPKQKYGLTWLYVWVVGFAVQRDGNTRRSFKVSSWVFTPKEIRLDSVIGLSVNARSYTTILEHMFRKMVPFMDTVFPLSVAQICSGYQVQQWLTITAQDSNWQGWQSRILGWIRFNPNLNLQKHNLDISIHINTYIYTYNI